MMNLHELFANYLISLKRTLNLSKSVLLILRFSIRIFRGVKSLLETNEKEKIEPYLFLVNQIIFY